MANNLWHTLSGLSAPNKARSEAQWTSFWSKYERICPNHHIFRRAANGEVNLSKCAALMLHGDEGRTKKKSGILVLSAHSVLGFGSHASSPGPEPYCKQKLNFLGPTWSSRWLLGVLPKMYYDDKNGDVIFQQYLSKFVDDMLEVYERGVKAVTGETFHFVILNTIGDWPWFQKAFSLNRCFANVSKRQASKLLPKGICHCCLADQDGFPWEDFRPTEPAWRRTINRVSAFAGSPELLRLPHDPTNPSGFLGQDCFHAWHIGAAKQFLGSCLLAHSPCCRKGDLRVLCQVFPRGCLDPSCKGPGDQ